MSPYSFDDVWTIDAPLEEVWNAVISMQQWPDWWPGIEKADVVDAGDAGRIGQAVALTIRGGLPYHLHHCIRIREVEPMVGFNGTVEGDLTGTGRWTFRQEGESTSVGFSWSVKPTERWMQLISPLGRPLFEWNHEEMMGWGEKGLNAKLSPADSSGGSSSDAVQ